MKLVEIFDQMKFDNLQRNIKELVKFQSSGLTFNFDKTNKYVNVIVISSQSLSPLNKLKRYFDKATKSGVITILTGKKLIIQIPISLFEV